MPDTLERVLGFARTSRIAIRTGPRKALAWSRVSTDMQEERGVSLRAQQTEIRTYADRNGFEIVGEYSETTSAFRDGVARPEFDRMIEHAKVDPDISAILVHDYSRLMRNTFRAMQLVRNLRDEDSVEVISITDPAIDRETASGVYIEAITFARSEAYSREVAFHTRKGCRANIRVRDEETGWCYKNGGSPLFGYALQHLERGLIHGRTVLKAIWVPNEGIVAGRAVRDWARTVLVDLVAQGKSLDSVRDFLNDNEVPAPRKRYWCTSTLFSMLEPHSLLKYAGYEVWNVHARHGRQNPPADWEIVPNAHEALISEEELEAVLQARERNRSSAFDGGFHRSATSDFLLSGGLFKCGRCGSNLMGLRKTGGHRYYICGSQPHRRGLGCGRAVYVPADFIEKAVIDAVTDLLSKLINPEGVVKRLNERLAMLWEQEHPSRHDIEHRQRGIRSRIERISEAVADGSIDREWARAELEKLYAEEVALAPLAAEAVAPPRMDLGQAGRILDEIEEGFRSGDNSVRKQLVRNLVESMTMAPESLEVDIVLRAPGPLVHCVVAGAGFEPATFGL
ncbi:MAG TPA: recombinase family protein [Candidatus Fermentibacter daniensis]|nr:recombinase family protein [Candidatus Fermentibacter daniensis]